MYDNSDTGNGGSRVPQDRARTAETPDSWILAPETPPELALYCFPPAGGGAATYRKWPDALRDVAGIYRVQPPGRENRYREPFCRSIAEYVTTVSSLIEREPERPFALFGHSMGAMMAFETALEVRQRTGREPVHLFASAFISPTAPRPEPIHHLPDDAFLQQLRVRYDGIPEQILQYPEVLELLLPIVRADLALISSYRYRTTEPLSCPLTMLGGHSDPWVDEPQLREWQPVSRGPFTVHLLPGGHFYLDAASDRVLQIVAEALAP